MKWFKKKTSIIEDFNIDIEVPKYLVNATADVWYDLTGHYFIWDKSINKFIYRVNIEDNSDKYRDLAIYLFDNFLISSDFLLLTPFDEYSNLYRTNKNGSVELVQPKSKSLAAESYLPSYELISPSYKITSLATYDENIEVDEAKDDIINNNANDLRLQSTTLGIYDTFELPTFLSDSNISSDETYFYNSETKRFQFFIADFEFYENSEFLRNLRDKVIMSLQTLKVFKTYSPVWSYCSIWSYEGQELTLLQKAKETL